MVYAHAPISKLVYLVFLLAFLGPHPGLEADDISFVTGTWNSIDSDPDCAPGYPQLHLQAGTQNNFTGTFEEICAKHNTCSLDGTVDPIANTLQGRSFNCLSNKDATYQGTITPDHTRIDVNVHCPLCDPIDFQRSFIKQQYGFSDVSQSSGIANNSVATTGVQWIDYNNDGKLDVYFVGKNGNALFKNIGKGKFKNVTQKTKTGNKGRDARGASWADIDNDGDLDLFIANATGKPTLLQNNHGVFKDISNLLQTYTSPSFTLAVTTRGGLWLDINNDKDIDLFIVNDGGPNLLYKHEGLTQFTEIASSAGVAFNGKGRSALATDLNNDGFSDIYLVNYHQPNKLYINNGNGTFKDATNSAGVGFNGGSVQAIAFDYNHDKNTDLFVVNNEGSSALYKNLGNAKFKNVTSRVLKKPKKGIAAASADYNNDTFDDLILAQSDGKNVLFQNKNAKFKLVKSVDLSNPDNPTGIAVGDFNGDGLPDFLIGDADVNSDHGDTLFQNASGGGNFIELTLKGTASNRAAIGAKALIVTGLVPQAKEVTAGDGQSQQSLPLNFGLGSAQIIDLIQIEWPSGKVDSLQNVPVNQKLTLTESQ